MLLAIGVIIATVSIWLIGGKQRDYRIAIRVEAQPHQLFPYLVQPDLKKRWNPDLISQTIVSSDTTIKEGVELLTRRVLNNKEIESRDQFIRFQRDTLVSINSNSDDFFCSSYYKLNPIDNDTEVVCQRVLNYKGLRRFFAVLNEDTMQEQLEDEMRRLVETVEKEVDNSIPNPNPVKPKDDSSDESDKSKQATDSPAVKGDTNSDSSSKNSELGDSSAKGDGDGG
jgi:hypothetical protein